MVVRTKTRNRLRILLAGTLLVCLLGAGGYVLRKRQVAARILRDRDEGYALLEKGDNFQAMHKIGPYVQRHPKEVEALLKYANARSKVEEPNGKHLLEAISLYRQVLELQPDNADARTQLLDLYLSVAFNTEVMSLTEGHNDPQSLRARTITLARLNRTSEAQQLALTYNKLKPQDLQMQMVTCMQMLRGGATADQIVAHAAELQKQHPDDPTFELLMSFAYATTAQKQPALEWAKKAVSKPISDPDTIDLAVAQLDGLEQYDDSLKLLTDTAHARNTTEFQRKLISRLYQSGHFDDVLKQTADLEKNVSTADADLLGHRALAFIALQRPAEARHVIDALRSRKGDFAAVGWSDVLAAVPQKNEIPDEKKIIDACREAMKSRPDNAYFHLYLGDSYSRLGASIAATDQWSEAASQAPVWATPRARLLKFVIASGQTQGIKDAAEACARLAPNDPDVLAIVAWAKARSLRSPTAPELDDVLKLVDHVQQLQPGEELSVGLKVKLLSDAGRKDQATQFIQSLLEAKSNAPEATLLAAAQASENAHLGLEKACFDRSRAANGSTFRLAFAQAMQLVRQKKADEAVKQFEAALGAAHDRDEIGWRVAWARVLDEASDPRAAKEFAQLADHRPDDPAIQQAVLSSRSAQTDRDLIRRVIDRVGGLLGDDAVMWRVADARWTMQGAATKPSAGERDQEFVKAAAILNEVTRRDPKLLSAQLLLSECLLQMNNKPGALDHLRSAADLAPASPQIALRLASMLQANGDFNGAKPYLDKAQQILESAAPTTQPQVLTQNATQQSADSTEGSPAAAADPSADASWRTLAGLLAARGETERAIAILNRIDRGSNASDAGLAELLARSGTLTDEKCRQLLATPTPVTIGVVADYYAAGGQTDEATAALAMLDKVEAAPGEKELVRGKYYQRRGDETKALEQLHAACAAAPSNRDAWSNLLVSLLTSGRADEAILTSTNASQTFPDDPTFKRVVAQAALIRGVADLAPSRPLMATLVSRPDAADTIIAALNVMNAGRSRQVSQVIADLKPLADRAPSLFALQNLLIEMNLRIGDADAAAAIATRSMQFAPADPAPAARAAQSLAAAGHWDQAIGIAKEWRNRLGNRTRPADLMLAAGYLSTGDFNSARNQLEPYLTAASKDPGKWEDVVPLYSQSLIGLGRTDEARKLLAPGLTTSAKLRQAWMLIAAQSIGDANLAAQWLDQVAPTIPADAIDEQLSLAAAWSALARRSGREADAQAAQATIGKLDKQMHAAANVTSEQWGLLASLRDTAGDDASAEPAYRTSLQKNPDDPIMQNNLAMVIFRRGGDLNEALALAEKAAGHKEHPARAHFLDTLAQIESKLTNHKPAETAIRQAIEMSPQDPEFRLSLVQVLLQAGKDKESQQAMTELDSVLRAQRQPDPNLIKRVEAIRQQLAKSAAAG